MPKTPETGARDEPTQDDPKNNSAHREEIDVLVDSAPGPVLLTKQTLRRYELAPRHFLLEHGKDDAVCKGEP